MAPRKRSLEPITFVSVSRVFKPQVRVRAKHDLNGWADRYKRVKWSIPAGRVGCIDADKAREFSIKGYVEILDGEVKPASEDEIAEVQSTVTNLSLGAT